MRAHTIFDTKLMITKKHCIFVVVEQVELADISYIDLLKKMWIKCFSKNNRNTFWTACTQESKQAFVGPKNKQKRGEKGLTAEATAMIIKCVHSRLNVCMRKKRHRIRFFRQFYFARLHTYSLWLPFTCNVHCAHMCKYAFAVCCMTVFFLSWYRCGIHFVLFWLFLDIQLTK